MNKPPELLLSYPVSDSAIMLPIPIGVYPPNLERSTKMGQMIIGGIPKYQIPEARFKIALQRCGANNPCATGAEPYAYNIKDGYKIILDLAAKAIIANIFFQDCLRVQKRNGDWRSVLGSRTVIKELRHLVESLENNSVIDAPTLLKLDNFLRGFVASAKAIQYGDNLDSKARKKIVDFRSKTQEFADKGYKPMYMLASDAILEQWELNPASVVVDPNIKQMLPPPNTLSEVEMLVARLLRAALKNAGSAPVRAYIDIIQKTLPPYRTFSTR